MLSESTFIKQGEQTMPETPVELINQTIEKVENILITHLPDYLNSSYDYCASIHKRRYIG